MLLAASAAAAAAAPLVAITAASQPVLPGETLVLHGAGFASECAVNVTLLSSGCGAGGCPASSLTPLPGQVADWSLKVTLPPTLPVGACAVVVDCPGAPPSAPATVNAAAPWWHQGDVGSAATQGGWLRVSGAVMALLPPAGTVAALQGAIRGVRDAMTAPPMAADPAWADGSALAGLAAQLLALRAQLAAAEAAGAVLPRLTVRLTPVGPGGGSSAAPVYLPADASAATAYSATFALPADLPPGEYAVAVANGYGADSDASAPPGSGAFVPSVFFESAARPAVGTIPVQPPKAWPPREFAVTANADPCVLPCPTSDDGLAAGLAAAAAAGGGVVRLGPGRFYLARPVVLPPNTLLAGSGANATAVWFAEWNTTADAPTHLFALDDAAAAVAGGAAAPAWGAAPAGAGLASWGLADFTLYVTGAYANVVYVSNRTDGFLLTRTRMRVNPWVLRGVRVVESELMRPLARFGKRGHAFGGGPGVRH